MPLPLHDLITAIENGEWGPIERDLDSPTSSRLRAAKGIVDASATPYPLHALAVAVRACFNAFEGGMHTPTFSPGHETMPGTQPMVRRSYILNRLHASFPEARFCLSRHNPRHTVGLFMYVVSYRDSQYRHHTNTDILLSQCLNSLHVLTMLRTEEEEEAPLPQKKQQQLLLLLQLQERDMQRALDHAMTRRLPRTVKVLLQRGARMWPHMLVSTLQRERCSKWMLSLLNLLHRVPSSAFAGEAAKTTYATAATLAVAATAADGKGTLLHVYAETLANRVLSHNALDWWVEENTQTQDGHSVSMTLFIMLLHLGVDPSARDARGRTARDILEQDVYDEDNLDEEDEEQEEQEEEDVEAEAFTKEQHVAFIADMRKVAHLLWEAERDQWEERALAFAMVTHARLGGMVVPLIRSSSLDAALLPLMLCAPPALST